MLCVGCATFCFALLTNDYASCYFRRDIWSFVFSPAFSANIMPSNDAIEASTQLMISAKKVGLKVLPYSLPSVEPRADPGVQAVNPQVTLSHPSHGGRLPLLSTRPAVTFPAEESHHPSASTKLYCLVTEAVTWTRTGRDSSPRPFGSRANALYRHRPQ